MGNSILSVAQVKNLAFSFDLKKQFLKNVATNPHLKGCFKGKGEPFLMLTQNILMPMQNKHYAAIPLFKRQNSLSSCYIPLFASSTFPPKSDIQAARPNHLPELLITKNSVLHRYTLFRKKRKPGKVVYFCNPGTQEAEAEGSAVPDSLD